MSKTRFLTLEDRFRMLPPDTNPFTVESIAEELGKTPEQAKRMLKSYIGQSEKALQNIEGNHVRDAELFDLKVKKLEDIGKHVIRQSILGALLPPRLENPQARHRDYYERVQPIRDLRR